MEDRDLGDDEDRTPWIYGGNIYGQAMVMFAGSRNRWVEPGKGDNSGFAGWVQSNGGDLLKLGKGRHFGEWWGKGIQRGYGLDEKRFSLFDVMKWRGNLGKPECCHVVPLLGMYQGMPGYHNVDGWIRELETYGSRAADFDRPEGIIIYHRHSNQAFKVTLENDEKGKVEKPL